MNRFFNRRAITVTLVVAVLTLMFAPLVRAAVDQQLALHRAEREVAERTARISEIDTELQRWDDDAYVEQQARERLMFVKPGDVPYIVLDDPNAPTDSEPRASVARPGTAQPDDDTTGTADSTSTGTSTQGSSATKTKTPSATKKATSTPSATD